MKNIDEIIKDVRLFGVERGMDGFCGSISMSGWKGSIICSTGAGWEHVSVSPYKRRIVPSWDDMCKLKDMFFHEDEAVIQIHPPKADYVNNLENCLHLWRCTYKDMVLPPSVLIGIREGQTHDEYMKEVKAAYEMAGEIWQ